MVAETFLPAREVASAGRGLATVGAPDFLCFLGNWRLFVSRS